MLSTMLTTRYYSSFVLTLTLLFLRSNGDDGLMCSTAPYSEDGFTGEIIRSWSYRKNNPKQLRTFAANYVPRYTFHGFAPVDDPTSKIYEGLDLFSTQLPLDTTAEFVTMKFQREAKVYLFVTGSNKGSPALTLPDWNPEGWAEIVMGSHTKKTELGIVKPRLWKPSKFAYVFSKATTAMEVKLPGKTYVAENLTGMTVGGNYWVMVAEEDGAAVEKPAIPANKMDEEDVIAGKHCPDWLHNEWKAPVRPGEYDVGENTFKTAHPIWDPCYWW